MLSLPYFRNWTRDLFEAIINNLKIKQSNYHVTQKKGQEGWNVQKENGQRVSAVVSTQKEAEKIAKQLSANSGGGEVRIHRPNGGPIRDFDTAKLGNDPRSSRDTRH